MNKEDIDFGSYVKIEQHRYGVPNEMYLYKVIGRLKSNHYTTVPVHSVDGDTLHSGVVDVLACICCGINETKVQKFRLEDVHFVKQQEDRIKQLESAIRSAHLSLTWSNTEDQIPAAVWFLEQVLPQAHESTESA